MAKKSTGGGGFFPDLFNTIGQWTAGARAADQAAVAPEQAAAGRTNQALLDSFAAGRNADAQTMRDDRTRTSQVNRGLFGSDLGVHAGSNEPGRMAADSWMRSLTSAPHQAAPQGNGDLAQINAAKHAFAQYANPATIGGGTATPPPPQQPQAPAFDPAAYLKAMGPAPSISSNFSLPKLNIPAEAQMPTLNLPKQDYNAYLQQATNALNFPAIDAPYKNAINLVGSDTDIAKAEIGANYGNMAAQMGAASRGIEGVGANAIAGDKGVEANLAAQGAAAAQATGATAAGTAGSLGMGSLLGQINSGAAAQNVAAQQYLGGGLQDSVNAANATTAAQVADNTGYTRAAGAKAQSDQINADMASQDAKAKIALAQGQTDLQGRETAAGNAMSMQQNAMQNALGTYNAQLQGASVQNQYGLGVAGLQSQYNLGQGQLQQGQEGLALQKYMGTGNLLQGAAGLAQNEQSLGLQQARDNNAVAYQNAQLQAAVKAAMGQNLTTAYGSLMSAYPTILKYEQTQPGVSGAYLGNANQLTDELLHNYGQDAAAPSIPESLLASNPDFGNAYLGAVTHNKKGR